MATIKRPAEQSFEFYTSKVPVEPTPVAPVARDTATSELGRALSSVGAGIIEKQVRVGKEIGLEKSSQAGTMAGSQLGFVAREEKSEQDIAFNRAAMRAQKMTIHNDIRNSTLGFRDDALRDSNLNSVNTYNARVKNYANVLMPKVSDALKPYAKNMIEYYGLSHKEPIVREVDMLNRNIAKSNLQLSYNNNLREATKAAFKGDPKASTAFMIDTKKNLDVGLDSGHISAQYHTHAIETFNKNVKFARYEGKFNNAIINNKANEELTNFENTNQKDLIHDEKVILIRAFNSMLRDHKQAIFAQYGNIENKIKDLNTAIYLNGTNPAVEQRIAKMKGIVDQYYSTNPDRAKQLKDSMDFASQRHDFRQANMYVNPTAMRSNITEKEQELKANPTFENAQNLHIMKSDLTGIIAERKANLYDIVSRNPAVIAATQAQHNSNQANVNAADGQKLGPATKGSIQDRDETMIQLEKQMGIPEADMQIVPPKQIDKLANDISSGDTADTTLQIQKLMLEHPAHMNEAMNQLQKKIPGANIMFFNGSVNPNTMHHRDYMMEAVTNKTNILEKNVGMTTTQKDNLHKDVRSEIMDNYGDAIFNKNGDPNKILSSMLDYNYKLALVYSEHNISSPAETAVHDTLKAHAKTDSFNGRLYVIPNNPHYNTNEINKASITLLRRLDPNTLRVPAWMFMGEASDVRQQAYKNLLLSDAYPALMENNNGMIMLDGARQPIKIMDGSLYGRPIGFTFQELGDKSNDLHKAIHENQAEELRHLKKIGVKAINLIPGFLEKL